MLHKAIMVGLDIVALYNIFMGVYNYRNGCYVVEAIYFLLLAIIAIMLMVAIKQ